MKNKKETFADLLQSFGYRYDLRPVFDDFLTMSICAASQNPVTRKSYYEDLYMATIAKYAQDDLRYVFPKMFAQLIVEMEERVNSDAGNDVLGEAYELNLSRKGASQYFTPWPVCEFMAKITCGEDKEDATVKRILEPSCGSGRMLVASANTLGKRHEYYGIDIDHTCVKMAVLNLFLNGIFHAEVMCKDALAPDGFIISYQTSFLPFGIFRIENKENSPLWHMHHNSFDRKPDGSKPAPTWAAEPDKDAGSGSQLQLF